MHAFHVVRVAWMRCMLGEVAKNVFLSLYSVSTVNDRNRYNILTLTHSLRVAQPLLLLTWIENLQKSRTKTESSPYMEYVCSQMCLYEINSLCGENMESMLQRVEMSTRVNSIRYVEWMLLIQQNDKCVIYVNKNEIIVCMYRAGSMPCRILLTCIQCQCNQRKTTRESARITQVFIQFVLFLLAQVRAIDLRMICLLKQKVFCALDWRLRPLQLTNCAWCHAARRINDRFQWKRLNDSF